MTDASAEDDDQGELVSEADEVLEPAADSTPPDPVDPSTTTTTAPVPEIVQVNDRLGRGINLGNALDAPREGDWGVGLDEAHFALISEAGFDHVRLPVSWAGYAEDDAPFTIPDGDDPTVVHPEYANIWERVDWAIEQAEQNDLLIVVDMHHYDEVHADPIGERDRFLALWAQIAERFADAGPHVLFELLNEPHQTFDVEPALWNELASDALSVVRQTNPTRPVLVGPVGYNSIDRLGELVLPDDPNLIATVHVYEPFDFTHQGATWVDPVPPSGVAWSADEQTLPAGVYDYSWDTASTADDGALRVDFQRRFAGLSFDYQRGVSLTEVSFRSSGAANLRIACRLPEGAETEVAFVSTTEDVASYSFDLRACADESTGIFIQATDPSTPPMRFESLVICSDRGCEELIQTGAGAIDALLQRAADWAARHDVPIHVGEFGAYGANGAAPLDSRVAWTAAVQEAVTSRDMSFAYWEFHSGFGIWNPTTEDWVAPLRDALLG